MVSPLLFVSAFLSQYDVHYAHIIALVHRRTSFVNLENLQNFLRIINSGSVGVAVQESTWLVVPLSSPLKKILKRRWRCTLTFVQLWTPLF
jgi:hypothetical protein